MNNNQNKTIVAACVVHILPENIRFFKELIENSPYVLRVIRFEESQHKLWIVKERKEP